MSYMTGPAAGPVGRGHTHKVPCCSSCAHGGSCASATGDAGPLASFAITMGAIGALIFFLPAMLGVKKRR